MNRNHLDNELSPLYVGCAMNWGQFYKGVHINEGLQFYVLIILCARELLSMGA
jgi:hypothetical protein